MIVGGTNVKDQVIGQGRPQNEYKVNHWSVKTSVWGAPQPIRRLFPPGLWRMLDMEPHLAVTWLMSIFWDWIWIWGCPHGASQRERERERERESESERERERERAFPI